MKHIVAATAVSLTLLLGQGAQAQEQSGGFFGGSFGPNTQPEGIIDLAFGKNVGRFSLGHKVLRCSGFLQKSETSNNWVSIPDPQYCPEAFFMNVALSDNVASIDVSAGDSSAEFTAERILPLSNSAEVNSPSGLDVLGLELGMTKDDVLQILVNERGYVEGYSSSQDPKSGLSIRSVFAWGENSSGGFNHVSPTIYLDGNQTLSIQNALAQNPRFSGMQFVLDRSNPMDDRVSVGLLDGRVFAVFRELSVDKNSLDAVYTAMNKKYGSFPKGTYVDQANLSYEAFSKYFGNWQLLGISPIERVTTESGGGRWGASSYRSDGSKIDQKLIANLHREPKTRAECMISSRFSAPVIGFAGWTELVIPSNCTTDAYFGILEQNRSDKDFAFIAIYQAFGVLDAYFEATLALHEEFWLDELRKIQSDAETQVETIVPEL